jgi:hypothetical protein
MTTWLTDAMLNYLDDLLLLDQRARRCPLGPADPHRPRTGWAYSLLGDPGHVPSETIAYTHDNRYVFVHLWHVQKRHIDEEWMWYVSFLDISQLPRPEGRSLRTLRLG